MKDHILKTVKPHAKDFNAADTVNEIYDWVVNTLAPQQCRQPSGSSQLVTNCNCLGFLHLERHERKALYIAEYLVHYAKMKRETKKELLYEWNKVAATIQSVSPGTKLSFMVPGLPTPGVDDEPNPMICKNALLNLLNEGHSLLLE